MVRHARVAWGAVSALVGWVGLLGPVGAQAQVVYRCPGPPVLYTDSLSPAEASSRNCKPLTDLPVAVAPPSAPAPVATPAPKAPVAAAPAGAVVSPVTAAVAPMPEARVRADDQRSRDTEARRILEAELRREEARLGEALRASGSGLKPGERLGADAAQIRRAESDIEAIRRELSRLR